MAGVTRVVDDEEDDEGDDAAATALLLPLPFRLLIPVDMVRFALTMAPRAFVLT